MFRQAARVATAVAAATLGVVTGGAPASAAGADAAAPAGADPIAAGLSVAPVPVPGWLLLLTPVSGVALRDGDGHDIVRVGSAGAWAPASPALRRNYEIVGRSATRSDRLPAAAPRAAAAASPAVVDAAAQAVPAAKGPVLAHVPASPRTAAPPADWAGLGWVPIGGLPAHAGGSAGGSGATGLGALGLLAGVAGVTLVARRRVAAD